MNRKFSDKKFRDAWVANHVKRGLATQLRMIRGDESQEAFGKRIGKPQNVVSRLEDPNYGAMSIQTLLDVASRMDVGLLVKFVPFSRVERETTNLTPEDLTPLTYALEIGKGSNWKAGIV